jgi:hypothetical protein
MRSGSVHQTHVNIRTISLGNLLRIAPFLSSPLPKIIGLDNALSSRPSRTSPSSKPPTSEDFLQRATEAVGLSDLAGLPKIISSLSREIMIAKLPRRLIHKVYTAMLASEVAGKRREEVVQYLTAMLEKFEGPTEVVEDSLASVNLAVPTREEIQRRLDQVTAEAATNPDI